MARVSRRLQVAAKRNATVRRASGAPRLGYREIARIPHPPVRLRVHRPWPRPNAAAAAGVRLRRARPSGALGRRGSLRSYGPPPGRARRGLWWMERRSERHVPPTPYRRGSPPRRRPRASGAHTTSLAPPASAHRARSVVRAPLARRFRHPHPAPAARLPAGRLHVLRTNVACRTVIRRRGRGRAANDDRQGLHRPAALTIAVRGTCGSA